MGWGSGIDSRGRKIGYLITATCDQPGCSQVIDRGVEAACGGMHGTDDPEWSCDDYFCAEHRHSVEVKQTSGRFACRSLCSTCVIAAGEAKALRKADRPTFDELKALAKECV